MPKCDTPTTKALTILSLPDTPEGRAALDKIVMDNRLAVKPNPKTGLGHNPHLYSGDQLYSYVEIRTRKAERAQAGTTAVPVPRPKFPEEVPGCSDPILWGHIVALTLRMEALEAALLTRGIPIGKGTP